MTGMFDNDKVFAPDGQLDGFTGFGEEFILWDCWIQTEEFEFDPKEDKIPMAHLVVSRKMTPEDRKVVSSLSGPICEKVRLKQDGELPAIVTYESVPSQKKGFSDAKVIRFREPYGKNSPA